ncbi:hypothetical protein ABK905_14770 [Acerihabitans sp. KWT182]|uniref:TIGR02646 family protein n=1 Tax=Acerihabitans sp. KWT182 TaxID=3157919 RepID=A0AAU7Q7B1_9GAMM
MGELSGNCAKEQFFICAYCCNRITGRRSDSVNEHVEARALVPARSLDYTNIVASCKTRGQCDCAHQSKDLPLTPFMDECETELKFKISGRVSGITERAKEAIQVLNLGENERSNKALIEKRKQLSDNLLWTHGLDPNEGLEDDALLQDLIDELLTPKEGKLEPFAPVVVSILKGWIS